MPPSITDELLSLPISSVFPPSRGSAVSSVFVIANFSRWADPFKSHYKIFLSISSINFCVKILSETSIATPTLF